jgi:hypothetical protein
MYDAFLGELIDPNMLNVMIFLNSLPDHYRSVSYDIQREARGNVATRLTDLESNQQNRKQTTNMQSNYSKNQTPASTVSTVSSCPKHPNFKLYDNRPCHQCATCSDCGTLGHSSARWRLCPKLKQIKPRMGTHQVLSH